jgi:hypothetical protein
VANYALIDGYLDSLRTSVRWRRDLDDLVAELEDHLYSAVEHFVARGTEPELAQQRTLERFGDPDLLATAFASTPKGGLAVPTQFTKTTGIVALISAAAWLIALVGIWISSLFPDATGVDPDQFVANGQTIAFIGATGALFGAGVLMVVTMVGLQQRHGGLGLLGIIGIGVTGLGVITLLAAWAFGLWVTVIGIGTLVFGVAMLRRDVAPRVWTVVWGAGMAAGAVIWGLLRWFEVGIADEWGNFVIADAAGVLVGVIAMAIGLAGIGNWLRNEEPVDIEPAEPLTTA